MLPGLDERSPAQNGFWSYLPLKCEQAVSRRSLCRGSARVVDAEREIALLRSGFGSESCSQAGGRVIGDARARLQDRKVAEVTELATVIEIVTVEQTGCCRGRGDNKECKDGRRGG